MTTSYDDYTNSGFDAFLAANPITGTIKELSSAVKFIKGLESQFEHLLGIGVGRNEANLITPYQNQLVSPPNQPLGIINTAYALVADVSHQNADDLNEIYQVEKQAIDAFYRYIGYPTFPKAQWPDGRASHQAYATIQPYADGVLAMLKEKLIAAGGTLHAIPNNSSAGSIGSQLANKLAQLQGVADSPASMSARSIRGSSGILVAGAIIVGVLAFSMSGNK